MNESKIAVRYAKALFSAGKENKSLSGLKIDFEFIYRCILEVEELQYIIESPVIKTKEKIKFFEEAFSGKFTGLTSTFIRLIFENHREEFLAGISRYFLDLLRKEQNIKSAEFISAIPVDESIRKAVISFITKKFDSKVDLQEVVNQRIIGGFILRVEDEQIDASISTKLNQIKKELIFNQI